MCPTGSPLMGGATPIPDSYMTASSYWNNDVKSAPYTARLYNSLGWCPSTAEKDAAVPAMWLQVRTTVDHLYAYFCGTLRSNVSINDRRDEKFHTTLQNCITLL